MRCVLFHQTRPPVSPRADHSTTHGVYGHSRTPFCDWRCLLAAMINTPTPSFRALRHAAHSAANRILATPLRISTNKKLCTVRPGEMMPGRVETLEGEPLRRTTTLSETNKHRCMQVCTQKHRSKMRYLYSDNIVLKTRREGFRSPRGLAAKRPFVQITAGPELHYYRPLSFQVRYAMICTIYFTDLLSEHRLPRPI